jgi:hypothetical protein
MKKIISIVILLILLAALTAQNTALRSSGSIGAYIPEYPDYDYNSPVYGFNVQFDIFNLTQSYGIGGDAFYSFSSYQTYFYEYRFYELYLHNIFSNIADDSRFAYGFFAGARRTEINYKDFEEDYNVDLMFLRPVIGFKYISNNWGITVRWTQNEKNRTKFEYELRANNSFGWILHFGGSLKGPVKGAKSDLHIYGGYEFFTF